MSYRSDPTDLTPRRFPFEPDKSWFEAYWYGEAPEPKPGMVRRAALAFGAAAAAAIRSWNATGVDPGMRHSLTA